MRAPNNAHCKLGAIDSLADSCNGVDLENEQNPAERIVLPISASPEEAMTTVIKKINKYLIV